MRKRSNSVSSLTELIPVNQRYYTATDYCSNEMIYQSQQYDDNVALEMQKTYKNITVAMKDQDFMRRISSR